MESTLNYNESTGIGKIKWGTIVKGRIERIFDDNIDAMNNGLTPNLYGMLGSQHINRCYLAERTMSAFYMATILGQKLLKIDVDLEE
jgi:hypothetical protein